VSDEPTPEPTPTPAEARLQDVLEPLRAEAPEPRAPLSPSVLRTLRWQVGVRGVLRAGGVLASAAADAVALVAGGRRGGR